ncbi:MAG: hypothetical protein KatS3mg108_3041 [Isosphaeraceae bacterium]|jgi:DNA mismatch repair protein MutS2|nr:MAG: hypothetical protein KatS3mg108_3041 [Isosphaeraceae bacterium]
MDSHTLELIEFSKVRALVARYAVSALGRWAAGLIEPQTDLGWVRAEQALTTEMVEALRSGLGPPLGGLADVRPEVRRAAIGGVLEAEELAELAVVLRSLGDVRRWLDRVGEQFPRLGGLAGEIWEYTGLVQAIEGCLDARGQVLDSASRRLMEIRREIVRIESRIQETLRQMLRSPEVRRILRYANFTMVGHHYVLPVAREFRGEMAGSVHRTSASQETVYVEPQAIADQSAQLVYQRSREQKEVRRILRWLSAQVGQEATGLLASLEAVGRLDLIQARARWSVDYGMSEPEVGVGGGLVLREARHPLLEELFRARAGRAAEGGDLGETKERGEVVPIDVRLGEPVSMLIVTGPNTGGKTVALKTIGLLAAMAQSGLHVPARAGSRLPIFDDVMADIGDEQSIEQSLSTFSAHVKRMVEILGRATARSLVLIDELGAGTDPVEGAALGRSLLDELDSIGCLAVVTTHLGDLKSYAFHNPRAENAAVEFDLESLRPLYRLRQGDVGQSNALAIARRLALPEHVVDRAVRYMERSRGPEMAEWDVVQRLRREAEAAREAAVAEEAEARRVREALAQKLADLHEQAEHEARMAEARQHLEPGDRVVVPRFGYDRPGRVVKVDLRRRMVLVAIGAMQWEVGLDELIPQRPRGPGMGEPAGRSRRPE